MALTKISSLAQEMVDEPAILDINEMRKSYSKDAASILDQIYISNFSHHFHRIQRGVPILAVASALEKYVNMLPCVVVGAGPSLNNDLENLAAVADDCFIICVDAALPTLFKKNGIKPNIVVCGDPHEHQHENFADMDLSDVIVFAASVIHPRTYKAIDRTGAKVLWFNIVDATSKISEAILRMAGRKGGLIPGVLTSGFAVQIPIWLGLNQVAFLGHDLSYPTGIDKGYCEGVSEDKERRQRTHKIDKERLEFPDINGAPVLTHSTFIVFWAWFNEHLGKNWTGLKVYNCSGQGILHGDNITQMDFITFANEYCKEGLGREAQKILVYEYLSYLMGLDVMVQTVKMPETQKGE